MRNRYMGVIKLGLLIAVLPMVTYMAAVSKSVALWREYRADKAVIEAPRTARPSVAESDEEPEDILKNGELLDRLSETLERNGVKAERYSPWLVEKTEGVELHVAQAVFTGGFIPLTKILQEIDDHPGFGQVVSAEYAGFTDNREKRRGLRLTVLLQQVTETKER